MVVPTKLKLLRGNPGRRPLKAEPEPLMPAEIPPPPAHIGDDAKAEWRRVAPELYRLGLLTICDLQPLAAYCAAYGRWLAAERAIAAFAKVDKTFAGLAARNDKGHIVRSPLVEIANCAARDMMQFAGQFGLTPVARTKLAMGLAKPASKFSGLIAG